MIKFLMLHGTGGSLKPNWFMWLKGILIGRGFEVWLSELPNSKTPNQKVWQWLIEVGVAKESQGAVSGQLGKYETVF